MAIEKFFLAVISANVTLALREEGCRVLGFLALPGADDSPSQADQLVSLGRGQHARFTERRMDRAVGGRPKAHSLRQRVYAAPVSGRFFRI
jgi:hypothetical protein